MHTCIIHPHNNKLGLSSSPLKAWRGEIGINSHSAEPDLPLSAQKPNPSFTMEEEKKKNEEKAEVGSYGYYSYSSESDSPVSIRNPCFPVERRKKKKQMQKKGSEEVEEKDMFYGKRRIEAWPRKGNKNGGRGVLLEGYVEGGDRGEQGSDCGGSDDVGRTKSLTDEDLEELKGCLDLGFGFSYEEIPELCNTLPALELCYSMSQRFLDEQHQRSPEATGDAAEPCAATSSPIANWKISSPGDHPEEVKARLKYWAQAVACTVRLCS